jgi:hypothetical protein
MGTRSTIAIQNADGTVTGIYCHWDGYLSHNGRILAENYTTEAQVRELIALGDLSSLGETVGSRHDFDRDPDGECNAYGRDRGETGVEARVFNSHVDLIENAGQEYDYLFTPGTGWRVSYYSNDDVLLMLPLEEAMENEGLGLSQTANPLAPLSQN